MFAISLLQPWAWAILYAGKDIENRTWDLSPAWRGKRVMLHASKQVPRSYYESSADTIRRLVPSARVPKQGEIPMGALVGAVTFTGSIRPLEFCLGSTGEWHFPDQFGWRVADPVALAEPVTCRGALGFWRVPEDVAARVIAQVEP